MIAPTLHLVESGSLSLCVELSDGSTVTYSAEFGRGTEIELDYEPVYEAHGLLGMPEPTGRHNLTVYITEATDFHGEIKRE